MLSSPAQRRLGEVLHSITVEDVLVGILKDQGQRVKFTTMMPGDTMTVQYDYGQFAMSYEEAQEIYTLLRLRGKVHSV